MLGVGDEGQLELMPGQLGHPFDLDWVKPRHSDAGEGGKGKGSACHPDTV